MSEAQRHLPLPSSALARCTVEVTQLNAFRIFSGRFAFSPLGTGAADSRFAWRHSPYQVLYCARDFRTAFLETVVRDQFIGKQASRALPVAAITQRCYARLELTAGSKLRLLDLRNDGCVILGIPTDVPRSMEHRPARDLGKRLYDHHRTSIDGIVFASRFTGTDVYAVFSHALDRLSARPAQALKTAPELADLLAYYDLQLIRQ